MLGDQRQLRSRLRRLSELASLARTRERPDAELAGRLESLAQHIQRSIQRREARERDRPVPDYPSDLPVAAKRAEILAAIQRHQVVILCGETGSGKTTQLPKMCLELGRGVAGLIGHTQPRRIAARSVAQRLADELRSPLGQHVGYKIRFGDRTSPQTNIKVMTDGILLAETQNDRRLEEYDTLIIDEAHERSLNIDFLLGYLRQLLPRRPDLKLIITSATIDPERFARHFGSRSADGLHVPAPIINVSGRTYPVEVRYRPPPGAIGGAEGGGGGNRDRDDDEPDYQEGLLRAVDELAQVGPGDILVFLSGEREIRESAEALRKHHPPQTEVLPLYARLSGEEQQRIFASHKGRRIVLATNVAETSLTVPGIRYVVDTGLARISRYSPRTKVQRLPIEAISRASADQRKGRCGRLGPGVCIRLYDQQDFDGRSEFTEPEILRTNLASVILRMKALGLGDVEAFPFVERPDERMIRDGYDSLYTLGAVAEGEGGGVGGELTQLGREMARLPIDPGLSRMLIAGRDEHCLSETLVIASALSIQDPRERPMDKADLADEAHEKFKDENSDFAGLLNLWRFYREIEDKLSRSKLRAACQTNFLSAIRMREWVDIWKQLHELVLDMGFRANDQPADYDRVHRAILTGLLNNIGRRGENFEYTGTRGTKFNLFPGSGLFKKGPQWVVAAELVRTTKLYARTIARVQPEWIEHVAPHLLKKTYTEPHWVKDQASVQAFEKVSVLGLEIVPRRKVHYGPIDPPTSRDMFIHHGLVEHEYVSQGQFQRHNLALLEQARSFEAKARRPNLIADAQKRFDFYAKRIAPNVYSGPTFEGWRRQAERDNPKLLYMAMNDVLSGDPSELTSQATPDRVSMGSTGVAGLLQLPLEYRFEPGKERDGITLTVPLGALSHVSPARCQWLVPAWLEELVLALAKSLPKQFRQRLKSVPEFARVAAVTLSDASQYATGPIAESLSAQFKLETGLDLPASTWPMKGIPDHLKMNLRVVDERGQEVAMSRDVEDVKKRLAARAARSFATMARSEMDRDGLTGFDLPDLPARVEIGPTGAKIPAFPALIERTDLAREATKKGGEKGSTPSTPTVSLRLVDSPELASRLSRAGLVRLYLYQAESELRHAIKLLPDLQTMMTRYASIGPGEELKDDLVRLIAERTFLVSESSERDAEGAGGRGGSVGSAEESEGLAVRSRAEFTRRLDAGWNTLPKVTQDTGAVVASILQTNHALQAWIASRNPPHPAAWQPVIDDIRRQLALLLPRRFIASTPWRWLRHVPRFLSAVQVRISRLPGAGLQRDLRAMQDLAPLHNAFATRRDALERDAKAGGHEGPLDMPPELERLRWMLEELRVSLFAQDLRTSVAVSVKRVQELIERLAP